MPVYNEITICGCQENVFASCILFALKYYICGKVVKHCTKYIITKITGNMETKYLSLLSSQSLIP